MSGELTCETVAGDVKCIAIIFPSDVQLNATSEEVTIKNLVEESISGNEAVRSVAAVSVWLTPEVVSACKVTLQQALLVVLDDDAIVRVKTASSEALKFVADIETVLPEVLGLDSIQQITQSTEANLLFELRRVEAGGSRTGRLVSLKLWLHQGRWWRLEMRF